MRDELDNLVQAVARLVDRVHLEDGAEREEALETLHAVLAPLLIPNDTISKAGDDQPERPLPGRQASAASQAKPTADEIIALLERGGECWQARELSDLLERVYCHFAAKDKVIPQTVRRRAAEVFGSTATADSWLRQRQSVLAGRAPIDVLGTREGREQVMTLLGRIEHGIYS